MVYFQRPLVRGLEISVPMSTQHRISRYAKTFYCCGFCKFGDDKPHSYSVWRKQKIWGSLSRRIYWFAPEAIMASLNIHDSSTFNWRSSHFPSSFVPGRTMTFVVPEYLLNVSQLRRVISSSMRNVSIHSWVLLRIHYANRLQWWSLTPSIHLWDVKCLNSALISQI